MLLQSLVVVAIFAFRLVLENYGKWPGTTWAAEMLRSPGTWYVHEPFFPPKGLWPEAFSYRQADEPDAEVDGLMERVFAGGHRVALHHPWTESPWMPMRLLPPPRVRRLLL